jgi:hypothetical protein
VHNKVASGALGRHGGLWTGLGGLPAIERRAAYDHGPLHPSEYLARGFRPLDYHAELLDRQGRVHARVSVDFAKEFGCYLTVPLRSPGA